MKWPWSIKQLEIISSLISFNFKLWSTNLQLSFTEGQADLCNKVCLQVVFFDLNALKGNVTYHSDLHPSYHHSHQPHCKSVRVADKPCCFYICTALLEGMETLLYIKKKKEISYYPASILESSLMSPYQGNEQAWEHSCPWHMNGTFYVLIPNKRTLKQSLQCKFFISRMKLFCVIWIITLFFFENH